MEKMWFYAQGTNRQGPVPESEIKSLLSQGFLAPTDLAWTEGMANWMEIISIPDLNPVAQQAAPVERAAPAQASSPAVAVTATGGDHVLPDGMLGWMGFVGVMNMVFGVISCLSCIGIITGIFLVMAGTALMGAKHALGSVQTINPALTPFFDKLKKFMVMNGVVYILGIVAFLIFIVFYLSIGLAAIAGATHH